MGVVNVQELRIVVVGGGEDENRGGVVGKAAWKICQ